MTTPFTNQQLTNTVTHLGHAIRILAELPTVPPKQRDQALAHVDAAMRENGENGSPTPTR